MYYYENNNDTKIDANELSLLFIYNDDAAGLAPRNTTELVYDIM